LIGFPNDLSKYPPLPSHVFAMLKKIWKQKRDRERERERKGKEKKREAE